MSEELKAFLRSWYEWATGDAEDGAPYFRHDGLCLSFTYWNYERNGAYRHAYRELNKLLEREFKTSTYPFGRVAYLHGVKNDCQHKDSKRLAWVRGKLNG